MAIASLFDDDNDASILSGMESSFRTDDSAPAKASMLSAMDKTTVGGKETRAVRVLRLVTLLVLLVTAFLCSFGIYRVTSNSQLEAFELEYYAQADKVIESFHTSVEEFLGSFDALSASITSYARDSGSVFPNVTVSDFEIRGGSARILAQGTFVQYMPLVTDDTRKGWEEYSTRSQGHLFPAFMREQQLKTLQDIKFGYADAVVAGGDDSTNQQNGGERNLQLETVGDQSFRTEIWGTSGNGETEAEGTGPYLPIWQMSPVLPLINLLNLNTLDPIFFNGPYSQVLKTGQASLGLMTHLDDPTDENGEAIKVLNALLSQGQYRHELEEYTRDPIISIGYPVFDSFSPDRKVVGILGSALYWRLLFKNVLPSVGNTIVDVVVRNSFGQAKTYRIDGAEVTFVGDGDVHNHEYDHMAQTANIGNYLTSLSGPDSRSYTAVDLNSNYVIYDIDIYPNIRNGNKLCRQQAHLLRAGGGCHLWFHGHGFPALQQFGRASTKSSGRQGCQIISRGKFAVSSQRPEAALRGSSRKRDHQKFWECWQGRSKPTSSIKQKKGDERSLRRGKANSVFVLVRVRSAKRANGTNERANCRFVPRSNRIFCRSGWLYEMELSQDANRSLWPS